MAHPSRLLTQVAILLSLAAGSVGAHPRQPSGYFFSSIGAQGHAAMTPDTSAEMLDAQTAAQEWLGHVDTGEWGAAWDEMAPGLRDTVAQEQWRTRRESRAVLGAARSRRLVRAIARDSLSRAPNSGPFILLRYHSTFGPELYVETVLVEDTGDAWRVAGYEVGPVAGRPERRPRPNGSDEQATDDGS